MESKLTLLLIALLLISPVSAKFICGEVTSSDKTTPSWYEVKTYLYSTENYSSTCKVSPSNNKYCCDLEEIKEKTGYQWKSLDIFSTKITDKSSGYFAKSKNLIITGEGYDISPVLELEKAISIKSPNKTLIISDEPIKINATISKNCQNKTISQENSTYGKNELEISAICNDEEFKESKIFYQIKNIDFKKSMPAKSKRGKELSVSLQANFSHEVENISLKEYVPKSWEIVNISNSAVVENYGTEKKVITWKISGTNFTINYKIKVPESGIDSGYYNFRTQFDEYILDESQVQIYRIVPSPFKPKPQEEDWFYIPEYYSKVSRDLPLFYQEGNFTAALYSNHSLNSESLNLEPYNFQGMINRIYVYIKAYRIQTTLNSTESGKMVMEYLINKTFLEKNDYKKIVLFKKEGDSLVKITGEIIASNEDQIKYRFESDDAPAEIIIFAEKKSLSFKDRILNFLDKIGFWKNNF